MMNSRRSASPDATAATTKEVQEKRNAHLSVVAPAAVLRPLLALPPVVFHPPRSSPAGHAAPAPPEVRETDGGATCTSTAAASARVVLVVSPFSGRRPTLYMEPYDHPSDLSVHAGERDAYVRPRSWHSDFFAEDTEFMRLRVTTRAGGPYARLTYIRDEDATPFSPLLCTLERAGFARVPPRRALLDTSWSLKWTKHPSRRDFINISIHRYQKLNHFPGSWRVGMKDALHTHLCLAQARWERYHADGTQHGGSCDVGASQQAFGSDLFPEAWVLPEENAACAAALRGPRNAGSIFIIKPVSSACGRGISLLQASSDVVLPSSADYMAPEPSPTPGQRRDSRSQRRGAPRLLIQRYMADPYLIQGYKFDLRLYVVVTSYEPVRLYMYEEGLVRFATTPYHGGGAPPRDETAPPPMTSIADLTAHLTNFTLNKKAAEFSSPAADEGGGAAATVAASKWCLAALRAHMQQHGVDWGGTMRAVDDLVVKTFLSIVSPVREELRGVDEAAAAASSASSPTTPPRTHRGISPYFELYGVDVLLRRPPHESMRQLTPTLMEVNVMPSLSTHYSALDQVIKGNFVADALTLVGLTSMAFKCPAQPGGQSRVSRHGSEASQRDTANQDAFLHSLTDLAALDACLTAEEEQQRSRRFRCLLPTRNSFRMYRALLQAEDRSEARTQKSTSLDEVLSLYKQSKEQDGA